MKASYLGKVIEYFNPMKSLDANQTDWYVNRPDNPHEEIEVLLLNDPTPLKLLFSGHIGSGKSSALNRLTDDSEIKNKFFVVQFSVHEDLNIVDLTYSDLLLAIGRRLFDAAGRAHLDLKPNLLNDLERWTGEVTSEWKTSDAASAEVLEKIRKLI